MERRSSASSRAGSFGPRDQPALAARGASWTPPPCAIRLCHGTPRANPLRHVRAGRGPALASPGLRLTLRDAGARIDGGEDLLIVAREFLDQAGRADAVALAAMIAESPALTDDRARRRTARGYRRAPGRAAGCPLPGLDVRARAVPRSVLVRQLRAPSGRSRSPRRPWRSNDAGSCGRLARCGGCDRCSAPRSSSFSGYSPSGWTPEDSRARCTSSAERRSRSPSTSDARPVTSMPSSSRSARSTTQPQRSLTSSTCRKGG